MGRERRCYSREGSLDDLEEGRRGGRGEWGDANETLCFPIVAVLRLSKAHKVTRVGGSDMIGRDEALLTVLAASMMSVHRGEWGTTCPAALGGRSRRKLGGRRARFGGRRDGGWTRGRSEARARGSFQCRFKGARRSNHGWCAQEMTRLRDAWLACRLVQVILLYQ